MVKYYGRARTRIGSVNTNQLGLKMSGCPGKVGLNPVNNRYIQQRVNCMNGICGIPLANGAPWRTSPFRNLSAKFCKPASSKCLAAAGGIGTIYTPYFKTNAPGTKGCGTRINDGVFTGGVLPAGACAPTPTQAVFINSGTLVSNLFVQYLTLLIPAAGAAILPNTAQGFAPIVGGSLDDHTIFGGGTQAFIFAKIGNTPVLFFISTPATAAALTQAQPGTGGLRLFINGVGLAQPSGNNFGNPDTVLFAGQEVTDAFSALSAEAPACLSLLPF